MPIQFSTPNSIWASVLVEVLARLGLQTALLCPGSRSTPLTLAFASHPQIEAIPVLDERSAAFFALGLAKRSGMATALVCTSGTAGANFYPAVIEAYESRVPLLVLTADRPPELRACNSGQTIDQQRLFGCVVNHYAEVAVPELDLGLLAYLRQTVVHAWGRSHHPVPGVVHLNLPFRDPLAPIVMPEADAFAAQIPANFFDAISDGLTIPNTLSSFPSIPDAWYSAQRGIIIAGIAQPQHPEAYCDAIATLANHLKFPVLAEGLSPVRNFAKQIPNLITTYDWILRNPNCAADLVPDLVIRVGEMPTSKVLREWLTQTQPRQWVIDPGDRNLDPLHGFTVHLRGSVEQVAASVSSLEPTPERVEYGDRWTSLNTQVTKDIQRVLSTTEDWIESKIPWVLSQVLPPNTPIFIANSMPIRDVEWFWQAGDRQIRPFANRGANGIDGTLSTALGIAHGQPHAVLLTGDLALLHDTNGFLLRSHLRGHLTIVLVNNDGGGIFEMLPISQFDPPFEEFFATPQSVDMAQLCRAYGVSHTLIQSWTQFQDLLSEYPDSGIRVLELRSDRKQNAAWRSSVFRTISHNL